MIEVVHSEPDGSVLCFQALRLLQKAQSSHGKSVVRSYPLIVTKSVRNLREHAEDGLEDAEMDEIAELQSKIK